MLICPKCKEKLTKINNSYKCINNHSYDVAKSGYINLLLSKHNSGDNKEMVDSRVDFLNKGYYLPLAYKLSNILANFICKEDYILDGGCGSGYYDSVLKANFSNIIGYDISKDAINKASRINKELLYIVCSGTDVPLGNNSVACILNIFAPTFEKEAYRLLKDQGILILVTPGKEHLIELKQIIYDKAYLNEDKISLFDSFELNTKYDISYSFTATNQDIISLLKMTPYFYKTNENDLAKVYAIETLDITASFKILVYKKKPAI